ncbi:hypothetical protein IV203_021731 [Nitzschia inconspicua]|uniref:Uncharacterized protein n=1 Tax=Nitzschia inconspicua TaxID=303405 RepID=A0A9K3PDN7_9STRA|nr:hypothetical protein IV203_021731 [Nitzschia inconspicua]
MAYLERLEEYYDGIEVSEVLPQSMDEHDVILGDSSRYIPSRFQHYPRRFENPQLYAAMSCAESEISFGTDFDQVFDTEVGPISTGISWEEMRQLLFIPSSATNGGDDLSSSDQVQRSMRRSNTESDLDLVFQEELREQQIKDDAEERSVGHLSLFRRRNRTGSGVMLYGTPLCSLKEDRSLDDQENESVTIGDQASVRTESYYTINCLYEDRGLLPPRVPTTGTSTSGAHTEPSPLGSRNNVCSPWNNNNQQQVVFDQRKKFICAMEESNFQELIKLHKRPDDEMTSVTSALTQSTSSYQLSTEAKRFEDPSKGTYQPETLYPRKVSTYSGMDPFAAASPAISTFDPFGSSSTTTRNPRKSLVSPIKSNQKNIKDNQKDNSTTTIPTAENAVRIQRNQRQETANSLSAIDAVLLTEFGLWCEMEQWDLCADEYSMIFDLSGMKAPSGCKDEYDDEEHHQEENDLQPDIFDTMIVEIDEILQSHDEDDDADEQTVSTLGDIDPTCIEVIVAVPSALHNVADGGNVGTIQEKEQWKRKESNSFAEDKILVTSTPNVGVMIGMPKEDEVSMDQNVASTLQICKGFHHINDIMRSVCTVVDHWEFISSFKEEEPLEAYRLKFLYSDVDPEQTVISLIQSLFPGVQAIGFLLLFHEHET